MDVLQALNAAHEQARRDHQHQGDRQLADNQGLAHPALPPRSSARARMLAQRALHRRPPRPQGRRQTEQEAGRDGDRERKERDAPIEDGRRLLRARHRQRLGTTATQHEEGLGQQPVQKPNQPQAQGDTGRAADHGEPEALGECLRHQPPGPGAERHTNPELALPAERLCQEQIGHIGAGNQEHERHGAEEHEHGRLDVADQLRAQGEHGGAHPPVAPGIFARQGCGHAVEVGICLRDRHARLQTADGHHEVCAAVVRVTIEVGRHEERRIQARRDEAGRHHAHHRGGPAVEHDTPADDLGIGVEALPPQPVAEHDHGLGAGAIVRRLDHAPSRRRGSEGPEVVP